MQRKWHPLAEIFPEKLFPELPVPVPVPRPLLRRDHREVRQRDVEECHRDRNRSKFPEIFNKTTNFIKTIVFKNKRFEKGSF